MYFPSEFTDDNEQEKEDEVKVPSSSKKVSPVMKLKLAVLCAFAVVTAGVVVFGVYLKRRQHYDFITSFKDDEEKIKDEIGAALATTMSVLDVFGTAIVSESSDEDWPFIYISNYAILAAKIMNPTLLASLVLSPIVSREQRQDYEEWVGNSSFATGNAVGKAVAEMDPNYPGYVEIESSTRFAPFIFNDANDTNFIRSPEADLYAPTLYAYPPSSVAPYNWNLFSVHCDANETKDVIISRPVTSDPIHHSGLVGKNLKNISIATPTDSDDTNENFPSGPASVIIYPLVKELITQLTFSDEEQNSTVVLGVLSAAFRWGNVTFLGIDYESPDILLETVGIVNVSDVAHPLRNNRPYTGLAYQDQHCPFHVKIYATNAYKSSFVDKSPFFVVFGAILAFLFMCAMFLLYSAYIHFQQQKIIEKATRSEAIVQSLFPVTVRERLYENRFNDPIVQSLLSTTESSSNADFDNREDPIAVVFADFSGFTAWSSTREPTQVIILLETVFRSFDELADRRGIFKVESVADCWLGVAGLPVARKDHALAICRFAIDCVECFKRLTKSLEVRLGPDTTDLSLRVGIHSGQVTAGVLRGKVIRFQLFGDTVNTASRMESTGKPGMIQLSEQTAELLRQAGKEHWLTKRSEPVIAKGKGMLKTFWLRRRRESDGASDLSDFEDEYWREVENTTEVEGVGIGSKSNRQHRLIKWTGGILMKNLRAMKAKVENSPVDDQWINVDKADVRQPGTKVVFDEVQEIICFPQRGSVPRQSENLDPEVEMQLLDFLELVANAYNDNPFHCHSHATHVTMSVSKLLSRIKAPKVEGSNSEETSTSFENDNTYGILDPLTQFACVFSALVHDLDHPGVSNAQLCKEQTELAAQYNNQSVAEQHSLNMAFNLLEKKRFMTLRRTIYTTSEEKKRFRQLVVNMVMATDIMDKDLKNLRNKRWERAFSDQHQEDDVDKANRKSTIVIEHIIQASDCAHTMQHWHIYRKWNQRLFEEIYKAYLEGRSAGDPSIFWFKGELGFFDNYVIPLAKKLQECGVLGVSGDEYLNYAVSNRAEWAAKGEKVVAEMKEVAMQKYGIHSV